MIQRRYLSVLLVLFAALSLSAQSMARYVFYFIGDGMGVNQVNATETYYAALEGRIGVKPLVFPSFPYVALVNTQSATNGVTDSAAGGTALATGQKTYNGSIGIASDHETSIYSIAAWAKKAGAAVGVATSVSVDHATPAAFYAHRPDRGQYYEIGTDLPKAAFDFYAGSDFLKPQLEGKPSLYDLVGQEGYTIARGYKDYLQKKAKARRMLLLQTEKASRQDRSCLPYAIDRKKGDMTLAEITRAGINFLGSRGGDGFFLMVEGGKIDWACHANDAATVIRELKDMDDAVKVAYEFYEQHPLETLIVVTADHETGGIVLGRGPYELHLDALKYQKMSAAAYTQHISSLHKKLGDKFTWEAVKRDLQQNFGFWQPLTLSEHQEQRLKSAYEALAAGRAEGAKNLYSQEDALATAAKKTLNEIALVGWQSGGHSNGYVPVFAIGVGAGLFTGRIDNTEIPLKIAEAAGFSRF
ncbi:MAG: alkaline phosphatase [Alloprevotella sp.]